MSKKQNLDKLESMLAWKKSNEYYAEKLGITVEEVKELKEELKEDKESQESSIAHNIEKGTMEVSVFYDAPPTKEIIEKDFNAKGEWKLNSYWSKTTSKGWSVSAYFTSKSNQELFSSMFTEFLGTYKPKVADTKRIASNSKENGVLIFPKQDSHLNKLDVDGDNDIQKRFKEIEESQNIILQQANIAANLEKIVYIIGSDELNSEFNNMTTKGTPQQNVSSFYNDFQNICNHEVSSITSLLAYSDNVEVIYLPGNHDHFAGWHLVTWLQAYFRDEKRIKFDITPDFTKYIQYSNTAMAFNHGDVIKPERLASIFPMEFKEAWSTCDHYYIFGGDKHTELSKDFEGIKFYRVPCLSNSKSTWDKQRGYGITKAEMNAFLIKENKGLVNIYKDIL